MAACNALLVPMADTLASHARWPSRVNPFLVAGRAVIMPRVGDLATLLEQHGAAMVVASSPLALADGVQTLLAQPALQAQYEHRGREVAQTLLAWPLLIDQLEALYQVVKRE
jgi:glycosyltransferase involved in cell wall biosynthesis